MKKISTLFMLAMIISVSAFSQNKTLLQEGTVVKVRLMETLNSKVSKVGDQVNLEVSEDVEVADKLVIKRGTIATGIITVAQPAKMAGKKGQLDFTIDYVKAVNDRNIKLRANSESSGKSKTGGVIAAAVLVTPFLIFVKGKDVIVEKGKEFSTYVDKDYELELK